MEGYTKEGNLPVKVLCIVHKVNPISDSLFVLCHHYRVSIREVRRLNNFFDDNISYFSELLIPYRGRQRGVNDESLNAD